jgi:UDPglucose--hexose-1-phosphate uridylyltransferase
VSPHRAERPWRGQVEAVSAAVLPEYDPDCYLCPGNVRAGGIKNSKYDTTFVFTNDYAALKPEVEPARQDDSQKGLLLAESESGMCKVVCFSPRHDLTLGRMTVPQIMAVVDVWTEQHLEIGSLASINYVQIFENRGEMMGCSNPHPHCQMWANRTVPNEPMKEQESQKAYTAQRGSCLLCDYVRLEARTGSRLVLENPDFVALVPFWAIWPFEILMMCKIHVGDLPSLDRNMRESLADILKQLATRYDNLFRVPFPYSMGFHQAPTDGQAHAEWHLHAHFYPPLLRSARIRKFMVGYEMLASPQRDITPEAAAARLREVSGVHYAGDPAAVGKTS